MEKHTPTAEQQAIIDAVKLPGSVMINAYAGCAKTTTLEMAAPGVKVPCLAVTFSKAATQEMEKRFPGNFAAKSFNGLGHGALMRALPNVSKIDLEEKKIGKLVTQVSKDNKIKLQEDQWGEILSIVRKAMLNGIVPNNEGNGLMIDSPESWTAIADELLIDRDSQEVECFLAREVLLESNRQVKLGKICFDDQVYWPTVMGGAFAKFPKIFVDEAQDLNQLNKRMVELSLRDGGDLIICGDPKQSIYAFRGADTESMSKLESLRDTWTHLKLATTFRCPRVVVARQQQHAPGFTAAPSNIEGQIHQLPFEADDESLAAGWNYDDIVSIRAGLPADHNFAILCRNNGPLLEIAFKLLRRSVGVVMLGRDLHKGLESLSRKLSPDNETKIEDFMEKLSDWEATETSIAQANDDEAKAARIQDRADCLRAVATGSRAQDVGQLRALLTRLFSRETGQVTLSSIHKAKGLEWDMVMHLDPWRLPSRQARRAAAAGDPKPLEQENNLHYVGETRTKNVLVNASLEDFEL